MMREKAKITSEGYFDLGAAVPARVQSGCTLLDCALGGGWALGRVVNIVGDKSTAKTALAVEALTNFVRIFHEGHAAYRDAENAFDPDYAQALGLEIKKVDFGETPLSTVEEFYADLDKFITGCTTASAPGIYVLDSLDALSTEDEGERKFGDQGYGVAKPKLLSELFRRLTGRVHDNKILLIIISQVRDNIGAFIGEKHKRSGGRALDFYASQIVWLAKLKTLKRQIKKVERAYGVRIKADVKKNKVGIPHRAVEFDFLFRYGVDDLGASQDWLYELGELEASSLVDTHKVDGESFKKRKAELDTLVKAKWPEIDSSQLPKHKKYE